MRKIEVSKWKIGKKGEEVEETLLMALTALVANKKPETIPRGLDKFRIYTKLSKAFDSAEKSGTLELDELEYSFLKKTIEDEIPSTWGMNSDLSKAIESFLDAKLEK